jgi:hypothetical protein
MLGKEGIVVEDIDPAGKIQYAGEIWNATTTGKRLSKGDLVRIAAVRNLMLLVEEMPKHEESRLRTKGGETHGLSLVHCVGSRRDVSDVPRTRRYGLLWRWSR